MPAVPVPPDGQESPEPLRVLAIIPYVYDIAPGLRYRIEQWEPRLREAGVEVTWAPFPNEALQRIMHQPGKLLRKVSGVARGFFRRLRLLRTLHKYDVVFMYREAAFIGPPILERMIARTGVPIVFDFDDAIFLPPRNGRSAIVANLRWPQKTATICRLAAHVTVGNNFLADYARQYNYERDRHPDDD